MDMKEQRFGIEIEMTGITRKAAADIAAAYFGTAANFHGTYYNTYSALDSQGRKWKFMSDSSISAQKKSAGRLLDPPTIIKPGCQSFRPFGRLIALKIRISLKLPRRSHFARIPCSFKEKKLIRCKSNTLIFAKK